MGDPLWPKQAKLLPELTKVPEEIAELIMNCSTHPCEFCDPYYHGTDRRNGSFFIRGQYSFITERNFWEIVTKVTSAREEEYRRLYVQYSYCPQNRFPDGRWD